MQPTVGIDFLAKNIVYKNKNYRLQLWDTAGQERFKSLIPGYLRDAHCALIIFDVANRSSLNNAENWLQLYNENKTGEGFTLLVGNKIDLKEQREVSEEEGKSKAKELGVIYYEVSAKTGDNLEELFSNIVEVCTEKSLEGANFSLKQKSKNEVIEEDENEGKAEEKPKEEGEKDKRIKLGKDKEVVQRVQKCC
jgi:Ras-related protein Rab-6A